MKKTLLFIAIGVILSLGAMSQENLLIGDCESFADWGQVTLGDNSPDVNFGSPMFVPKYGDGNCLWISYKMDGVSWETYLYQTVTLEVGKTYEFSGAFKDAGTVPESNYYWFQIALTPVNDYDKMATDGPDWETFGENPSFLTNFGKWASFVDNEGGLEKDTTFTFCSKTYGGAFTGVFNEYINQGDTTIFTIPNTYPTRTGGLELGADGTSVDFFFIFYFGMGESGNNEVSFTFDEFSIHEYGVEPSGIFNGHNGESDHLNVYPNPVEEKLHIRNVNAISSVSMVNIVGQEVLRVDNVYHHKAEIVTSALDRGIYILIVTDTSGESSSRKIIKK